MPRRSAVTAPKKKPASRERVMQVKDPSLEKGELKAFGGSRSDDFNRVLLNEIANTLWTKNSSEEWQTQQLAAVPAVSEASSPGMSSKACSPIGRLFVLPEATREVDLSLSANRWAVGPRRRSPSQ